MNIFQKVTLKTLKVNRTRTIVTIIGIILSLSMFTAVTTSVSSFQHFLQERAKVIDGNWHVSISVSEADCETLRSDSSMENVFLLEHIGYARLEGGTNLEKPYLFIGGLGENLNGALPIRITEGRMPENETELLIPNHLSYNGGVNYDLNETVTLDIGRRVSEDENGELHALWQNTPYLYTEEERKELKLSNRNTDAEAERFVPEFSRSYTVVGFYDRPATESFIAPGYTALTVSTPGTAGPTPDDGTGTIQNPDMSGTVIDPADYTAYLLFQNPNDAIPWLSQQDFPNGQSNSGLLRMYAASYESSYNSVLYGLATVLIVIILFGSISLIYNAFSISVTERTKQFGLLASLGATKRQLVRSILFEAVSLCVIGIPVGVLAGIVGIGVTFSLLGGNLSIALMGAGSIPLTLYVSPWSVAGAVILGMFTVLISAWIPSRRAARLSPIDAIRQTADINIRSKEVRTSRLTYRIFGLSGMLAAKNFKRNRKKYRATVLSLFVSVVLFISASSFCSYLMNAADSIISDAGCDIVYYRNPENPQITNDMVLKRLAQTKGVTESAWVITNYTTLRLDKSGLSDEYLDFTASREYAAPVSDGAAETDDGLSPQTADLYFVNDSAYDAFCQEAGISTATGEPARTLALAFDFYRTYDGDTGKYSTFHLLRSEDINAELQQVVAPEGYRSSGYYTDENDQFIYYFDPVEEAEGDALELPAKDCTRPFPLKLHAVREYVPFFLEGNYSNGLILLFPASAMEAVLGDTLAQNERNQYTTFYFTAEDHKSATANIADTLRDMGLDSQNVHDYAESAAQERTMFLAVMVFSYGFIILISLIAIANVFNTISTNIQLRKREFAMLRSTGMTPKGFGIMMCYECLLYGIKGLLYGLPVSVLVTWWIYRSVSDGWETNFYIPWYSLVIAIGSVFLVVGSTMVYSMHKVNNENIMDNLKNDNA